MSAGKAKPLREKRVCAICAREIIFAGGAPVTAPREIGYGFSCEVHPGEFASIQATQVVTLPEAWELPTGKGEEDEWMPPLAIGPVTSIAVQLLAALGPDGFDDSAIARAVDDAKRILRRTKGA